MLTHMRSEDRPRERLKKFGASKLSDSELTQILIGSGTSGYSLGKIARAVLKAIRANNADITYAQLETIPGMGPAKIAQILSAFELSSRYPVSRKETLLDSFEAITAYLSNETYSQSLSIITTDGAGYVINKRSRVFMSSSDHAVSIRHVVSDVCSDNAQGVIVVIAAKGSSLSPTMAGLQIARELRYIGGILQVKLLDVIIDHKGVYRSVLEKK